MSLVQTLKNGKQLYAVFLEEWNEKAWRWEAMPIRYLHADSQGDAKLQVLRIAQRQTHIVAVGLAIGFFDSGATKKVEHSGVRGDEHKPILVV